MLLRVAIVVTIIVIVAFLIGRALRLRMKK